MFNHLISGILWTNGVRKKQENRIAVRIRNHYLPRTSTGKKVVLAFVLSIILSQPPVVFMIDEKFQGDWLLGFPFLYSYLTIIYFSQIGILIWALRRKV